MDTLFRLFRLGESFGIVIQFPGLGLGHIDIPTKLEQPLVQDFLFQDEPERVVGVLLCEFLQVGLPVIRLLRRQVLQVRTRRIAVADLFVQQTVLL